MDIVGDRRFIEIPGEKQHELPPLLVHTSKPSRRLDKVVGMANDIIDSDDLLPDTFAVTMQDEGNAERRKMDLAINLVEQYFTLVSHWHWGNGIVEWIRQCEITFGRNVDLRNLLRNDLWPHASRSSFVTLLADKSVETGGVDLTRAVGLRLTFRQPPPISCFSNQFLFYLNSTVAATAYETWAHLTPEPINSLPPERFSFQVFAM